MRRFLALLVALIGVGLAVVALSLGFAPAAVVGWLVHRSRHST